MHIPSLIKGVASYIPGVYDLHTRLMGTWGTGVAPPPLHYYYIWLYHLLIAKQHGLRTHFDTIAEIGPGDTLGTGLAALLSGTRVYYALDIVSFANREKNLKILDGLVTLFQRREKIPVGIFAVVDKTPGLTQEFPHDILTDELLERTLKPDRIAAIREAIAQGQDRLGEFKIRYCCPWNDPKVVHKSSVDFVFSSAVMEHVDDLPATYHAMNAWLKPGGMFSHQIDFRCHKTGNLWNEHWSYSDRMWAFIRGRRKYLINRQPLSVHLKLAQDNGLNVVANVMFRDSQGLDRRRFAERFQGMSEDDATTYAAIIQGIKQIDQGEKE